MNKRIEWIDIARGIGILLVVLGHSVTTVIRNNSITAKYIYDAVYFVHVPLLLFVSGIAFNLRLEKRTQQSIKTFTIEKCKRLMLPYVSYSFLVYLIFSAAYLFSKVALLLERMSYGRIGFKEWLFDLFVGNNVYSEHLWYLYTLFLLSILAFSMTRITGKWYRYIILVITILIWLLFRYPTDYDVIWKTAQKGVWFALGCFVNGEKIYSKSQRFAVLFSGVCAVIVKVFFLELLMDSMIMIRNVINMLLIGILMFSFVALAQIIQELGGLKLNWIGKNSMSIYLFHQPFLGSGLGVILYSILHLNVAICIIIAFLACIVIPLLSSKILEWPKLKTLHLLLLGN